MDGVLNIFKNKKMTSFDVVRKVKKVAHEKKVGHTGTLDPEATGVLPVCLGRATKIIDYIMNDDKSYYVSFKLGVITTTYDMEGDIIEENSIDSITEEQILKAIDNYRGEYLQVPPMYSALKKDGVRLYELARKGIEIEREGRKVNIKDINDINIKLPIVSMNVTCSKGTYIRSLCYDIGQYLKVGATVTELKRTRTSNFFEADSVNIDDLDEDNIQEYIIPIKEALNNYPSLVVNKKFQKLLSNGVKVCDKTINNDSIKIDTLYTVLTEEGELIGLGKRDKNGFKIEKLLN
ncbi:tRNA pseudouridine(55) synthase TruB [Clostridium sp. MSJ-8]|jgi:tRNA pseudouridine55 synthase|uniref:tRNA pseudouridine(55) synthase TruB n=1 Tax=Clostridium sp. MSJ-8 TaxID=2841510 RepID=UPI001C0EB423|nr:tRNA pseudouridine(55) synthase TruB [Clostridium sp. MSJ-8]MBU5488687.1 tRNA pseudouridine(55) synthase TruB [Clostridium sp. MSJ-8]